MYQRYILLPTHSLYLSLSDPQGRVCLIESNAKNNNQQKNQEQAVTSKTEEKKARDDQVSPIDMRYSLGSNGTRRLVGIYYYFVVVDACLLCCIQSISVWTVRYFFFFYLQSNSCSYSYSFTPCPLAVEVKWVRQRNENVTEIESEGGSEGEWNKSRLAHIHRHRCKEVKVDYGSKKGTEWTKTSGVSELASIVHCH